MLKSHQINSSEKVGSDLYSRSYFFVPAHRSGSYERLKEWDRPDIYVFDLEDSCPKQYKELGRKNLMDHTTTLNGLSSKRLLRINHISEWDEFNKDLSVLAAGAFQGVMLPMIQSAGDLTQIIKEIDEACPGVPPLEFHVLIETPAGLANIEQIAGATKRLVALCFGSHDLFAAWNAEPSDLLLWSVKQRLVNVAKANNLLAIDTPYLDIHDFAGFQRHCKNSLEMGMDGSMVIHPDHVFMLNRTFSISEKEYLAIKETIEAYEGGCLIRDGRFIGPPMIKKMKQDMRKEQLKPRRLNNGVQPETVQYGLDLNDAHAGKVIACPYEITVDESWITSWHSLIPSGNYVETSKTFAQSAGLQDRVIPFSAILNLTLCMAVEPFSETCLLHLGMEDVRYETPAYPGDTFNCFILIEDVRNTSDGKRCVVSSQHVLVNQHGQRDLSFQRKTLFPRIEHTSHHTPEQGDLNTLIHSKTAPWNISNPTGLLTPGRSFGLPFEARELILHDAMRTIGKSENLAFSTLYRNTHPIHFNYMRFKPKEIIVCGGFVMAIVLGNTMKDFKQVVQQRILNCSHLNKVTPEDNLSSVSLIYNRSVSRHFETLNVVTLGLIEVDPAKDLLDLEWPAEIFPTETPKPNEYEKLVKDLFPDLFHKVCIHVHWEITRLIAS